MSEDMRGEDGTGLGPAPKTDGLTFGEAIIHIQLGARCSRRGWNGRDMWIAYSPGSRLRDPLQFWSPANQAYCREQAEVAQDRRHYWPGVEVLPCVTMKTADGKILMGWLASQTDMLARDWFVVDA